MANSMGRLIRDISFAAIDFESAGEKPNEVGLPVQIGIARMEGLTPLADSFFRSYLRSERPGAWAPSRIHGITDADLREAPDLLSLWPQIKGLMGGRHVVAHGSGTEKRFLRAFPMHGFGPWVDTLTLSRKILPGRKSYALSDLAAELALEEEARLLIPGFRWHEALSDALASLLLLRKLIELAGIADHPGEALVSNKT